MELLFFLAIYIIGMYILYRKDKRIRIQRITIDVNRYSMYEVMHRAKNRTPHSMSNREILMRTTPDYPRLLGRWAK